MERKSFDIRPEDIIPHPEEVEPDVGASSPGIAGWLTEIKDGIQQVSEAIKLAKSVAKELNINIPGIKTGETKEPTRDNSMLPSGYAKFVPLAKEFIAKYGNLTVNQFLEKLKEEYGSMKLKDLIK